MTRIALLTRKPHKAGKLKYSSRRAGCACSYLIYLFIRSNGRPGLQARLARPPG